MWLPISLKVLKIMRVLTEELLAELAMFIVDKLYPKPMLAYSITLQNTKLETRRSIRNMLLNGFEACGDEIFSEVSDIKIISVVNHVAKGVVEINHIDDLQLVN